MEKLLVLVYFCVVTIQGNDDRLENYIRVITTEISVATTSNYLLFYYSELNLENTRIYLKHVVLFWRRPLFVNDIQYLFDVIQIVVPSNMILDLAKV